MSQIEIEDMTLPAQATIKVELSLTADINFTAHGSTEGVSTMNNKDDRKYPFTFRYSNHTLYRNRHFIKS